MALRNLVVPTTAACIFLAALDAYAGRPLSTEDADTLGPQRCQLESWIDRSRDLTTGWLVPACNLGMAIEWQAGFARTRESGQARFSESYFQAKRTFIAPEEDRTGLGVVIGVARRPLNERHRGWSDPYAVVALTRPIASALLHANLGWARDKEARRSVTTWGIAGEWPLDRWTGVAEAFGENSARPSIRAGIRWAAIAETLDIDLTWVGKPGGVRTDRYLSIGFTWVTSPFSR